MQSRCANPEFRDERWYREFRKSPGFSSATGVSLAAHGYVFDARLTALPRPAVKWFRTLRSAARGGQSGNVSTRRRTVCWATVWVCRLIWQQAHADCGTLQMARTVIYMPVRFIDLYPASTKNKLVRSADVPEFPMSSNGCVLWWSPDQLWILWRINSEKASMNFRNISDNCKLKDVGAYRTTSEIWIIVKIAMLRKDRKNKTVSDMVMTIVWVKYSKICTEISNNHEIRDIQYRKEILEILTIIVN